MFKRLNTQALADLELEDYPTVFVNGQIDDVWGIWRSTDRGDSWRLLARYPAGYYTPVHVVAGDMNIFGRDYVGLYGNSFVYGDDTG